MKKLKITLLSSIVVLSMILAACSSSGNSNGTPAATLPGGSTTSQPTGSASQMPGSTPSVQTTQPAVTQPAATTPPVTQPAATETQSVGGTPSGTQALPSTGAVDPGLVSNLTNFQVVNPQNQQLGTAKDLILNMDTKKVDYIVLSVGGFLGIGSADIPVPWDAFEINGSSAMSGTSGSQPNSLALNVSKNVISQAPQLDTSAMPEINQSSPGWDSNYKSYWQSQLSAGGAAATAAPGSPAATQAATQPATQMPSVTASPQVTATTGVTSTAKLTGVILASKMLNANIEDSSGQSIGSIADVVVDISTGDVQYALISYTGGGAASGTHSSSGTSSATQSSSSTQPASTQAPSTSAGQNQWTPVPLEALGWDAQNQAFTLNVDQQTLSNAPSFAPGQFPNTQQSGWDSDIKSYWQNNMPSTTTP